MANVMTAETRSKLSVVHKKLATEPARLAKLREIAQDPVNKEKRAVAMRARWADPVWRAAQLTKMKRKPMAPAPDDKAAVVDKTQDKVEAPVEEAITHAGTKVGVCRKQPTDEQKVKYAANRKAKRDAAKAKL